MEEKIRRALVSCTDKTGLVEFCRALVDEFGIEVVSTGGTAGVLLEAGIPVRPIDDFTGSPEMMDGRVKTLHPAVHGGLLALRDNGSHMDDARENGIGMIDLLVVNPIDFAASTRIDGSYDECVGHIDIGGVSMIRSAAKNHRYVTVITDPARYGEVLREIRENEGETTLETRRRLALDAFELTSAYDASIASWMRECEESGRSPAENPGRKVIATYRWRLVGGKLPLYERHIRSMAHRDLGPAMMSWVRTRLEWTLDNLAFEHPDGVIEVTLDTDDGLDMTVEDAREYPAGEAVGQRWDVYGDVLIPDGEPVDATQTLVRDLAKTLHYTVADEPGDGDPTETFYVSDEFGAVAFDDAGPVTRKMIECFDKLWSRE